MRRIHYCRDLSLFGYHAVGLNRGGRKKEVLMHPTSLAVVLWLFFVLYYFIKFQQSFFSFNRPLLPPNSSINLCYLHPQFFPFNLIGLNLLLLNKPTLTWSSAEVSFIYHNICLIRLSLSRHIMCSAHTSIFETRHFWIFSPLKILSMSNLFSFRILPCFRIIYGTIYSSRNLPFEILRHVTLSRPH